MEATSALTDTDRLLGRKGIPHRRFLNNHSREHWVVRTSGSLAGRLADSRRACAHGIPRRERQGGQKVVRRQFRVDYASLQAPLHEHQCGGCEHRRHCTRTDCAEVSYGTCSACRTPHMHHRHSLS